MPSGHETESIQATTDFSAGSPPTPAHSVSFPLCVEGGICRTVGILLTQCNFSRIVERNKTDTAFHMTTAIILSGGSGTRLGGDIPKQYLEVSGQPIIMHGLGCFEKHPAIDSIIIVAAGAWQGFLSTHLQAAGISKFKGFAEAGRTRQHSIWNGLQAAKASGTQDTDGVIIHDAARPHVSCCLLDACIDALEVADGALPVIPAKDTLYLSHSGACIDGLLNRDEIFAGQAPESFNFGKYYVIHATATDEQLAATRGSCEIAHRHGMKIKLVPGDENNYKITTKVDLEKFQQEFAQ